MVEKIKTWFYRLLINTQKYSGTDNIYLAKGGFWLILGQIVSSAAAFLLALALGNWLDPTTYGNYRYILSLVGILVVFTLEGMGTAITQATARNLEGSFYTGFKMKLKWGLLGSLIAIGGAVYYWIRGNLILPIPLLISAVFLPLMYASGVYNGYLTGKKLFNVKTKYNIVGQIISAGAIIITLFFTKNIFWLISVYFVSHTFLNYFFYFLTSVKFKPNKKEDPQTLSYGKHLSLMKVIDLVATQLDKMLLFTLIGSAQLAVYYFALIVPDQIRDISKTVSTLALPKLSTRTSQEIKVNMKEKSFRLFLLASIIIITYVITAPYIYKILFPQYLNSVFYSQIYIFSLLALPVTLMSATFQAKAKKKELYFLQIMPFVQIILLVCLIPFFGIMGALTAVLATKALGITLIWFLFRRL